MCRFKSEFDLNKWKLFLSTYLGSTQAFFIMSFIANNIKAILEIKIKTRHDSYTDQFSRIFMVKMFIISSLVIGIDWFHDTVACIVPNSSDLSSKFVHSACWIQGKFHKLLLNARFYQVISSKNHVEVSVNFLVGNFCKNGVILEIYGYLFPQKSSENLWYPDDFRGGRYP